MILFRQASFLEIYYLCCILNLHGPWVSHTMNYKWSNIFKTVEIFTPLPHLLLYLAIVSWCIKMVDKLTPAGVLPITWNKCDTTRQDKEIKGSIYYPNEWDENTQFLFLPAPICFNKPFLIDFSLIWSEINRHCITLFGKLIWDSWQIFGR